MTVDGIINIWQPEKNWLTGKTRWVLERRIEGMLLDEHDVKLSDMKISPDGFFVIAISDFKLFVWKVQDGSFCRVIECGSPIKGCVFSPSGLYLAVAELDGGTTWYDLPACTQKGTLEVGTRIRALAFSQNDDYLV